MDRIFALSTPPGRSGVAVLRISGKGTRDALASLCGRLPVAGRTLRSLRDNNGEVIDQALVLIFPEGASFTGEEVVELQVHGSAAVVKRLLALLSGVPGCRQAEAGEFTRRAMENGLLDLAQVEGLADLIDAETEAQRRQSVRLLTGDLGRKVEGWRDRLVEGAGLLAASIDFADEDIPASHRARLRHILSTVCAELRAEVEGSRIAERIRDGFEIAIVGPPNVGKSTLLNRLAGREAALVSEIAGTTRDVIEVRMDIGGFPVTLLDTAGIRQADDALEVMGIGRAVARASNSDLRIHLVEPGSVPVMAVEPKDILLWAKGDLVETSGGSISGLTGLGVDEMLERVERSLVDMVSGVGTATSERHRKALTRALDFLGKADVLLGNAENVEDLVAEDVRSGIRAIDSLVLPIDVEEVLGWVFSRFCVGK